MQDNRFLKNQYTPKATGFGLLISHNKFENNFLTIFVYVSV